MLYFCIATEEIIDRFFIHRSFKFIISLFCVGVLWNLIHWYGFGEGWGVFKISTYPQPQPIGVGSQTSNYVLLYITPKKYSKAVWLLWIVQKL